MERNKCINIDCIEGFKKIPDDTFDLVLTDPPYGVRSLEEWDDRDNFLKNIDLWLQECIRVSKSTVIWFCADKMIPYILKNREDIFHRLLIWNKPAGSQYAGAQNNNIWFSMEPILVFSKNLDITKSKGKKSKYGYAVLQQRTIPKKKFNHPTTKAEPLMRELIMHYSDEGDFILDPFSGSGSTLVSAKQLNRNFLGFELDENHCNTINNRISQETLWTAFDNTQAPTSLESFNRNLKTTKAEPSPSKLPTATSLNSDIKRNCPLGNSKNPNIRRKTKWQIKKNLDCILMISF